MFYFIFVEGVEFGFFVIEEYVLNDVEVVVECEILVDDFNVECGGIVWVVEGYFLVVELYGVFVIGLYVCEIFD